MGIPIVFKYKLFIWHSFSLGSIKNKSFFLKSSLKKFIRNLRPDNFFIFRDENKINILLGTQMIAKGLDFKNITLVVVINADIGLMIPDFKSHEKVFQLIYQVSGRAGRRKKQGMAIIQTYNPNDIYIRTASSLNTKQFYNIAMAQRQELNYPPFSRIGRIILKGVNKKNVYIVAKKIFNKSTKKNSRFKCVTSTRKTFN